MPKLTPLLTGLPPEGRALLAALRAESQAHHQRVGVRRLPSWPRVPELPAAVRYALARGLVEQVWQDVAARRPPFAHLPYLDYALELDLLAGVVAASADWAPAEYLALLGAYLSAPNPPRWLDTFVFPVVDTLAHLRQQVGAAGLPARAVQTLDAQYNTPYFRGRRYEAPVAEALRLLEALRQGSLAAGELPAFSGLDGFGRLLADFAATAAAAPFGPLLRLWQQATGATPGAKFLAQVRELVAAVGPAAFAEQAGRWLDYLTHKPLDEAATPHYGRLLTTTTYLSSLNLPFAKGLVWTLLTQPDFLDERGCQQLGAVAARAYRKLPGIGPGSLGLGNACAYALAQAELPGVAQLARLRLQIRHNTIERTLTKQLHEVGRRLGLSLADLEDLAVPTYGLAAGRARHELPGAAYYAELRLHEPAQASLRWFRADGTPLKAAPAALRQSQPAEVKALTKTLSELQQTVAAQRDRLERAYLADRAWTYAEFAARYLPHPLLGWLAQRLIWHLTLPDGPALTAAWSAEAAGWVGPDGQPLPALAAPAPATRVQLWHPARAAATEGLAWRQWLEARQLRQPFKQAYREVYLLTPPEQQTRTYSNRMAAHVLKQHQLSALARQRGWHYRLMGAFDHGSEGPTLDLPAHGLQAEFRLSEVLMPGATTELGIYQYVSTDQVRFWRRPAAGRWERGEPVPLAEVPPVVFSEVMRDVDLFVGVASVGNDPTWRDGGEYQPFREYWENYSFGALNETAKTRRLALERLVPRLKIGRVSTLTDRFLVVRGRRRTYKIHLGSGNILMEPNDQYLCIVPDRAPRADAAPADVFLPFEGDAVLSIILSKAQLLMDDDQITDETILRQLR